MNEKVCSTCGELKGETEFYLDKRRGKRRTICKVCLRANSKTHPHRQTPERKAEDARKKGMRDCEYIPRTERLRIALERKAIRETERAERIANKQPPKPKQGSKAWYASLPKSETEAYRIEAKMQFRERYKNNTESERARVKRYKQANPHMRSTWDAKRLDRIEQSSDGSLTDAIMATMKDEATHCAYCEQPFLLSSKTIDHVVPLRRGGAHSIDNVVVACRSCNESKGIKTLDDWIGQTGAKPMTNTETKRYFPAFPEPRGLRT